MGALDQNYRKTEKIAIAGRCRVGKTTLAEKLAEKTGLELIRTDDYIDNVSFDANPMFVIDKLKDMKHQGYIVEGVQVARMLRKGLRLDIWQPDTVIIVENPLSPIQRRHAGIATMNRRALDEWLDKKSNDVRVIREQNCFRLSQAELNRPNRRQTQKSV
jgi:adenylate kinase family enzyme